MAHHDYNDTMKHCCYGYNNMAHHDYNDTMKHIELSDTVVAISTMISWNAQLMHHTILGHEF